ncbi:hypothetical protein ScPMuIL_000047 [Solemya velum]
MAASNFPVPEKMEMKGDLRSNWKFFQSQWENYEIATGLDKKDAKIRVASLLSIMGKDCYRLYSHLDITEEQKKSIVEILTALKNISNRQPTSQEHTETVHQYVAVLRRLSDSCDYGALKDDMIRDRLVIGTKDNAARARMLREPKLDLKKAVDTCLTSEISQEQLKKITSEAPTDTVNYAKHKYKQSNKYKPSTKQKGGKSVPKEHNSQPKYSHKQHDGRKDKSNKRCKCCGGTHDRDKSACPAYGETCDYCGKKNHFTKLCLSRKANTRVKMVEDDDSSDDSVYKVHTVGKVQADGSKWYVDINMQVEENPSKLVKCQMDTGSTCNLMGFKDYCKIVQDGKPSLNTSTAKLRLYDGSALTTVGEHEIKCRIGSNTEHLTFQIVQVDQKPLLSADTCKKLKLLTVNEEVYTVGHSTQEHQQPLTSEQVLNEYQDVFNGLGCLPGEYHMELNESVKPVQHLPRRVPAALKTQLQEKIKELEKLKVIVKVTTPSEWISSMVAVQKPGKLRICIDPKDLNTALQRSHYPMPTIDEILPKLAKAKVFSTLDAKDGFWQVKLDEKSSFLTTFWTPFGRYRWLRMPFGISSAPEEYQRRQHEAVEGLKGVEAIVDDILVYGCGDTEEEAIADHDRNLIGLLERARQINLKLNKKKFRLRMKEVKYMGHLLTKNGLKPDPEKISAILDMPRPTDVKGVQRFIGFVTYLSKFLKNLSGTCEPLRALTKKGHEWAWQKEQEDAFNNIKHLVTNHPVLRYYDVHDDVTIQCDASESGLGAALMQNEQPIAFASRALTSTEKNYAQIEKECLAIVFACEHFNQYIFGRDIIHVQSDHKPLQSIFNKPLLSAPKRLQRMLLRLQRYRLEVKYKKGTEMYIADMLSRAYLPLKSVKEATNDCEIFEVQQQERSRKSFEEINFASGLNVTKKRLQEVGIDLFSIKDEEFMVTVDYYSDFWELDCLGKNTKSTKIIKCLKKHFSRHGIPDYIISDNGPQFASEEFRRFADEWEIEHNTSSPYHSQSNGKAESAVKIAKQIVKKSRKNSTDLWKAILEWRNTPTEGFNSSPVQRLMSRRTQSSIPMSAELLKPKVIEGVKKDITAKRQKAKGYYDMHAKKLPDLQIGEPVRVQLNPTLKENKWQLGTCVEQVSPRSYVVDINGTAYRRNRKHIRSTSEKVIEVPIDIDIQDSVSNNPENKSTEECGCCKEEGYCQTVSFCTLCSAGQHQNQTGQSECEPCDSGYYQNRSGQSLCLPCGRGHYQNRTGQSKCDICQPGQCQNQTGQSECESCEPGNHQTLPGQVQCQPCDPGHYQNQSGQSLCRSCVPGQYQNQSGQAQCEECEKGTHSSLNSSTVCNACRPGHFSNTSGAANCDQCLIGWYQPESRQIDCLPCPAGFESRSPGSANCTVCKKGSFKNETGPENCRQCPKGSFSDQTNSTNCTLCAPGYFQDQNGSDQCFPCHIGVYCNSSGCDTCLPCLQGTESLTEAGVNCTLCEPGYNKSRAGNELCQTCPPGYFTTVQGSLTCKICPNGYFCPQPDKGPIQCPVNSYCPPGSASPTFCQGPFYVIDHKTEGCEYSEEFIALVTGLSLVAFLALIFISVKVYRYRKKRRRLLEETHLLGSQTGQQQYTGL